MKDSYFEYIKYRESIEDFEDMDDVYEESMRIVKTDELNKIVNREMLLDIAYNIEDETIICFYDKNSEYHNESYDYILKETEDFIFKNLKWFEREVENFEDFDYKKHDYNVYKCFNFVFKDIGKEVCFYVNVEELTDMLVEIYNDIKFYKVVY